MVVVLLINYYFSILTQNMQQQSQHAYYYYYMKIKSNNKANMLNWQNPVNTKCKILTGCKAKDL
jgi:hypothetical protein